MFENQVSPKWLLREERELSCRGESAGQRVGSQRPQPSPGCARGSRKPRGSSADTPSPICRLEDTPVRLCFLPLIVKGSMRTKECREQVCRLLLCQSGHLCKRPSRSGVPRSCSLPVPGRRPLMPHLCLPPERAPPKGKDSFCLFFIVVLNLKKWSHPEQLPVHLPFFTQLCLCGIPRGACGRSALPGFSGWCCPDVCTRLTSVLLWMEV